MNAGAYLAIGVIGLIYLVGSLLSTERFSGDSRRIFLRRLLLVAGLLCLLVSLFGLSGYANERLWPGIEAKWNHFCLELSATIPKPGRD